MWYIIWEILATNTVDKDQWTNSLKEAICWKGFGSLNNSRTVAAVNVFSAHQVQRRVARTGSRAGTRYETEKSERVK